MKPTTFIKTAELIELKPQKYLLCVEESNAHIERNTFKSTEGAYAFALTRYSLPKHLINFYPLENYESL